MDEPLLQLNPMASVATVHRSWRRNICAPAPDFMDRSPFSPFPPRFRSLCRARAPPWPRACDPTRPSTTIGRPELSARPACVLSFTHCTPSTPGSSIGHESGDPLRNSRPAMGDLALCSVLPQLRDIYPAILVSSAPFPLVCALKILHVVAAHVVRAPAAAGLLAAMAIGHLYPRWELH